MPTSSNTQTGGIQRIVEDLTRRTESAKSMSMDRHQREMVDSLNDIHFDIEDMNGFSQRKDIMIGNLVVGSMEITIDQSQKPMLLAISKHTFIPQIPENLHESLLQAVATSFLNKGFHVMGPAVTEQYTKGWQEIESHKENPLPEDILLATKEIDTVYSNASKDKSGLFPNQSIVKPIYSFSDDISSIRPGLKQEGYLWDGAVSKEDYLDKDLFQEYLGSLQSFGMAFKETRQFGRTFSAQEKQFMQYHCKTKLAQRIMEAYGSHHHVIIVDTGTEFVFFKKLMSDREARNEYVEPPIPYNLRDKGHINNGTFITTDEQYQLNFEDYVRGDKLKKFITLVFERFGLNEDEVYCDKYPGTGAQVRDTYGTITLDKLFENDMDHPESLVLQVGHSDNIRIRVQLPLAAQNKQRDIDTAIIMDLIFNNKLKDTMANRRIIQEIFLECGMKI